MGFGQVVQCFCFIQINPSGFERTATSVGPPTVCCLPSSANVRFNVVILTKLSAKKAISGKAINLTLSKIG
ncbi:MAG: hypothetical protein IKK59_06110 [Lachnospiraceae bacterium]|nr:hypothetical protein [Lachnospiraceae bacterium]